MTLRTTRRKIILENALTPIIYQDKDYLPASVTNQPQPAVSINAGEGPAQPNEDILQPTNFNATEYLAQPNEDILQPATFTNATECLA
ncbi:hypothetical protein J6590_085018 [Homalodisca vitripennis]|nr:hypothetical protein J6590_085018 [Homalodisca vitripennis]